MPERTGQKELNAAVWYAVKHGGFFPVRQPKLTAGVLAWVQWGAMRNLHTAIAKFYPKEHP